MIESNKEYLTIKLKIKKVHFKMKTDLIISSKEQTERLCFSQLRQNFN